MIVFFGFFFFFFLMIRRPPRSTLFPTRRSSDLRRRSVSFERPILLLTLLAIPLGVVLLVLLERRRMRYALRFTNLDVLATVVGRRPWRRHVPAALLGLALASLLVALARPHVNRLMASDR